MNNNNSQEILIVGSGFAGLISAISLQQSGIPFKLFEATNEPVNIGGSVTMFPNSMKVLRLVGVADNVIKTGVLIETVKFQDDSGKHLVNRPQGLKEIYGEPTINIRRAQLHEILRNRAIELGIDICYGKQVAEIKENNNSVELFFEDQSSYSGKLLIGSDGINSVVRKHILNQTILPKYTGLLYIGGFVRDQKLIQELSLDYKTQYVSVGPTCWFAYSHMDNENAKEPCVHWYSYVSQPERISKKELLSLPDSFYQDKASSVHAGWHQPIQKLIDNTEEIVKANVSDIVEIERWYKGRSIVVGDAAHAMNPVSGQGAGTAMEDGYLLTKLIEQHNEDHTLAFENLVKLRKERTSKIAKKARKSSGYATKQLSKSIIKLRNISFAALTYFTPESRLNKYLSYDVEKELAKTKN